MKSLLLHEFPDISWLKKAIAENFRKQQGWDNEPLIAKGWPTVLLQFKAKEVQRKEIKGPFSLFLNKSGFSQITCDQRSVKINDDAYVATNAGQLYDLEIQGKETEISNIHFGQQLLEDTVHFLSKREEALLWNIKPDQQELNLSIRSTFRSEPFNKLVTAVEINQGCEGEEESLFNLLSHVLLEQNKDLRQLNTPLQIKKSTQEELIKRVYLAVDYIHSQYATAITLDLLANIAMLSKYHFLRVFKSVFTMSPLQYVKCIRIQKAVSLLKSTDSPLYLVAAAVGVENASSLSRMMYQELGIRPSQLMI